MNGMIKTIVIATSLKDESDAVVRAGVGAARAAGARAWLVHAFQRRAVPLGNGPIDSGWVAEQMEWQASEVRTKLAEQARRTGLAGLPGFGQELLYPVLGSPRRAVVDVARTLNADLIVAGAAEGGALKRTLLGSTTDGVIRRASCPVLIVRSEMALPPARVEIAVDLSPLSAGVLREGLRVLLALGSSGRQAAALFVLSPLDLRLSPDFTSEQVERFARQELGRLVEANRVGAAPRLELRTGEPREEILAALAATKADLAILGTHGRSGFDRLLLGSVATEVMRLAGCNLLVVPPEAGLRHPASEQVGADWEYVSDEVAAVAAVAAPEPLGA
jgi:nucleotide-binding universal stress UspA family protein